VVMPGRDVGTVIVPDADLKIWLDASLDERARRRHREVIARGAARSFDQVRSELASRDAHDGGREVAPMRAAADAIRIDTERLTALEVIECVLELARARGLANLNGRKGG
jgi:CMP/dCMP kinase